MIELIFKVIGMGVFTVAALAFGLALAESSRIHHAIRWALLDVERETFKQGASEELAEQLQAKHPAVEIAYSHGRIAVFRRTGGGK